MAKFLQYVKPWIGAALLIAVLHFTGLLGAVSYYSQRMLLGSGFLNSHPESTDIEAFPFDFQLQTLDGKQVSMTDLKGKVLFLNLWATWCGPCRAEMPGIQNLYSSEVSDSIVFIMLSLDKKGDEVKIQRYVKEKELTLPIYRPVDSLPEKLRVPSIPVTFVINKEGNIVYEHVGVAQYDTKRFKKFLHELAQE